MLRNSNPGFDSRESIVCWHQAVNRHQCDCFYEIRAVYDVKIIKVIELPVMIWMLGIIIISNQILINLPTHVGDTYFDHTSTKYGNSTMVITIVSNNETLHRLTKSVQELMKLFFYCPGKNITNISQNVAF